MAPPHGALGKPAPRHRRQLLDHDEGGGEEPNVVPQDANQAKQDGAPAAARQIDAPADGGPGVLAEKGVVQPEVRFEGYKAPHAEQNAPRRENGGPHEEQPQDHGDHKDRLEKTPSYTLTMYDGLYTWYREHVKKTSSRPGGAHPANLDVKFNSGDDLPFTLADSIERGQYIINGSFPESYGPCAPIIYCLGHQACTFRYSNEFCLQDPLPGKRKTLRLRLTCESDEKYNALHATFHNTLKHTVDWKSYELKPNVHNPGAKEDFVDTAQDTAPPADPLLTKYAPWPEVLEYRQGSMEHLETWPNKVVFVKYLSQMERGIKSYTNTSLVPLLLDEPEVFDVHCPTTEEAFQLG